MPPTKKTATKPAAKQPKKAPARKAPAPKEPVATKPTPQPAPQPTPQVELIDLARLAQELHQPLLQVRKMVQGGQIPGVKVDGEWRFNLQLVREAMLRRSRGR